MDLFWSMLWFFLFFAWIWLLIMIFSDIFRSHDLSGWGKAFWTIFVVILPWLGVLIYLIARGGSMQERAMAAAVQQEKAQREYIQQVSASGGGASSASSADELKKLAELQSQGVISAEEFAAQKAKILA
jgi:hypothetical protein